MEKDQVEKQFAWLDEQHRKTADEMKELRGQLKKAQNKIDKQAAQISDLNSEISRLAGQSTRIHQMDETLQKHRKEVSRQLEAAEERRTEKESNLDALRKSDQMAISQRVEQLQLELNKVTALEGDMAARLQEEIRLAKEVKKLEKQLEKLVDGVSIQGDQVKAVSRLSDQLQKDIQKHTTELGVLRKTGEESRGTLEVLTDSNRALDVRVGELAASESERSQGQARWVERQELTIVEFENAWKKWGRRFDAIELNAGGFDERLAAYEEMHRSLKQMRTELGELMERLERRITEVSEMQRLGENRLKHEWSSFQADDVKRWNTYKLTTDEQWREHNRTHERLSNDLESLTNEAQQAQVHITRLSESERMRLSELLSMFREWVSELSEGTE